MYKTVSGSVSVLFGRLFRKKKYVLLCKADNGSKSWEPVAELEKPITLTEAKALYGEDCVQLRLEEVDAKTGKRVKIMWVEPKRKERTPPSPLDYLAEMQMMSNAVKAVLSTFRELAQELQPQQQGGGGVDDFLKLLLSLRGGQGGGQFQAPAPVQQQPPPSPPSDSEVVARAMELLKEHIKKDKEDVENAPCAGGACYEEEG